MTKILIVDDEADILEFLGYNLEREGFEIYKAMNGNEAIKIVKEQNPHLIILDVMMPGIDGIETCREIKKFNSTSVILFLTARSEDRLQIEGFESGADDYVVKPIQPKLLISRVKALLKRFNQEKEKYKIIEICDLKIDQEKYQVSKGGKEIILTKKEFELLSLLSSKPNRVFTRDDIFAKVWGEDVIVGDRTIDVHIRKIREKLGIENIKTIKGVGYKFEL